MLHNSFEYINAYCLLSSFKDFLNSEDEENIIGFIEEIIFLIIDSFVFSSLISFLLLSQLIIFFIFSINLDSIK